MTNFAATQFKRLVITYSIFFKKRFHSQPSITSCSAPSQFTWHAKLKTYTSHTSDFKNSIMTMVPLSVKKFRWRLLRKVLRKLRMRVHNRRNRILQKKSQWQQLSAWKPKDNKERISNCNKAKTRHPNKNPRPPKGQRSEQGQRQRSAHNKQRRSQLSMIRHCVLKLSRNLLI